MDCIEGNPITASRIHTHQPNSRQQFPHQGDACRAEGGSTGPASWERLSCPFTSLSDLHVLFISRVVPTLLFPVFGRVLLEDWWGEDAGSLLNPRSVGNRVIRGHAKHGHPFEEVPVEGDFPQRWVPDIPPCSGVPVLSQGWSCLAQGLGRVWELPWERDHPGCSVPLSRVCPSVSCDSSDHGSPKAQAADLYCPLVCLDHSLSWAWGSHSPASRSSTMASGSGWERRA